MTSPPPRNSTSRSNRDDVMQLLDSLDTYTPTPPSNRSGSAASSTAPSAMPRSTSNSALRASTGPTSSRSALAGTATGAAGSASGNKPPPSAAEAQSVLDFLDEITQRSSPSTAGSQPTGATIARPVGTLGRSSSRQSLSSSTGPSGGSAAGASSTTTTMTGSPAGAVRRSIDTARPVPTQRTAVPRTSIGNTQANAATKRTSVGSAAAVSLGPETASCESAPVSQTSSQPTSVASTAPNASPAAQQAQQGGGGWGWSSMWNSATTVVQQASNLAQQAKTAAEEQVKTATSQGAGGIAGIGGGLIKALGENEQAKKWSEGVMSYAKGAHLDQLGRELKSTTLKSLSDLLNAVAPPIAEHEVIEVSLSHDMVGYDGVESLVYRGFAKIMDQIEGGTLVVNSAASDVKPKETEEEDDEVRNLNVIDGLSEGWKLAESSLEHLIKTTYKAPEPPAAQESGVTVPVTTCPVYMRLQPCLAPLPALPSSCLPTSTPDPTALKSLFFLVLLRDPTHKLVHSSLSQSMPASWLDIPFEENEWVEDAMVEIIRRSVEIIGQEYITHRMRAQTVAIEQARAEAQKTLEQHQSSSSTTTSDKAPRSATVEPLFDAQTEADASQAAQEARVGVV